MNLVDGPTTLPGCCFLCERAYDPQEAAVFTGQVFDPDFPHRLYGSKTVCANCAKAVAEAHNFVVYTADEHADRMAALTAERDVANERAARAEAKVDEGVAAVVRLVEATTRATEAKRPRAASKVD